MDLRRIENIIRIAEEKNITRAADKLFISQPALNLQLLNLEKELGTKLFYRRGNEWAITEAGRKDIKAITGGGGCQEYFRMIADEKYADLGPASALYSPSMVQDAIKTAIDLLNGGTAESVVVIPTTIVSAENVADFLDPNNTVY